MNTFEPNKTMLNNYIQNKLSDTETEQLELYLTDHPDILEDLEMDIMFKQGITELKAQEKKSKPFAFLDFLSSKKLIPLHLLAYGLVGFLLFNTFNNKEITQNSSATFIELEKQRGLDTSTIEVQTAANKSLVLRFFPDSMTEKYSLILNSETSNQKIEFKDLQADDFGSITVTMNNSKELSGKWEVLLNSNTLNTEQIFIININAK